jgi:hypothetical protein
MARLGHSTPRASLIYQHATEQRDHEIAIGIDELVGRARKAPTAKVTPLVRARSAHDNPLEPVTESNK